MLHMPPVAVLAGGLGTRLYPVTKTIPKNLIEVAGKPFVAHQLELFARRGIQEVVFCLGYLGEQVEEYVGDGNRFGLSVRYSYDGAALRGTGGAIRQALSLLGPDFLVTYGDSYLNVPYDAIIEVFRERALDALMTVYRNEGAWDTSNVEYEGGWVRVYDKKNLTPRMCHIDYGLLVLRQEVFVGWEDREAFDLSDLLSPMAASGKLAGFETTFRFYEIGSRQGISDFEAYLGSASL